MFKSVSLKDLNLYNKILTNNVVFRSALSLPWLPAPPPSLVCWLLLWPTVHLWLLLLLLLPPPVANLLPEITMELPPPPLLPQWPPMPRLLLCLLLLWHTAHLWLTLHLWAIPLLCLMLPLLLFCCRKTLNQK